MNQCTDFLYHYTSIETLALILSNRTFRLNSLDQMDDLQEKETSDIKNIGQFCYISSSSMMKLKVYRCGKCTVLLIPVLE